MEFEAFIKKMKDIYSYLLDFIDATDDSDDKFKALIDNLNKHEILENQKDIRLLFRLISKITDNHYRTSDTFDKLEKLFRYLIKDDEQAISYFISNYYNYNKPILFLLLEKKIIKPDKSFLNIYLHNNCFLNQLYYYIYPVIKEFLEEKIQKNIENEILIKFKEDKISTFEEKCKVGENDSYICSLIRSDSVEEFIAYVNRTNLSLMTKINPTIYETNSFLIDKQPTLIEYASFFGSIQIVQYLKYNKVPLTSSLWLYTIHSNKSELIHFLEENEVKPKINEKNFFLKKNKKESFDEVLIESIKCHHNAISNYIKDNLYEQVHFYDDNQFYGNFSCDIADSLNFFFFPNEIESIICKPENLKGFNLRHLCFLLTKITIPSSVTSIGNYAFYECSSLTQISIPSSVTSIGDYAFCGCSLLMQMTIPSSVTSIGNYAFGKCEGLKRIFIPSSVTSFGDYIFDGVESLEIAGNVLHIPKKIFSVGSSFIQIIIPSSVTSIEDKAFSEYSLLTKVSFESPTLIKSIGNYSFSYCKFLTQISVPSSVNSIGNFAFNKCTLLEQISIPSTVQFIGNFAFNGCSKLKQILFENNSSLTTIGESVFADCASLTEILIPKTVTSIGNYAFYYCKSLIQISFETPSSVTSIGNHAFYGCSKLMKIAISSSINSIEDYAFYRCSSLSKISFEGPSSLASIGNNAFSYCVSLTQILLPSSVKSIGNNAFKSCLSLSSESKQSIDSNQ